MKLNQLVIYNSLAKDTILKEITSSNDELVIYDCINQLINIATEKGFEGNIWKCYISYLLVMDENIYTKSCEKIGAVDGSLNDLVLCDLDIIYEYYNYSLNSLSKKHSIEIIKMLENFTPINTNQFYVTLQNQLSNASSGLELKNILTEFYKKYGVGSIGLNKAFRIDNINGISQIIPITNISDCSLDDLVGCEIPKKQLIANTNAFINGKKANNCLLFGNAGTGKSTSIKAISNQYYDQGLRIIEVYKHQFQFLGEIIEQLRQRNYKFIIYLDDLSFDEFEIEYKYLKAIIEGSLSKKPDNVLIYATSNRRHLVRELYSDRANMKADVHTTETMQEKLSLATRFGESIYFSTPTRKEFFDMVSTLAKRNNIQLPEDELIVKATKWEFDHSDQSGRTAQQFIDFLLGSL